MVTWQCQAACQWVVNTFGHPARGLFLLFGSGLGTGDAIRIPWSVVSGRVYLRGGVSVMGDMVPSCELEEDKVPSTFGFSALAFTDMCWV